MLELDLISDRGQGDGDANCPCFKDVPFTIPVKKIIQIGPTYKPLKIRSHTCSVEVCERLEALSKYSIYTVHVSSL